MSKNIRLLIFLCILAAAMLGLSYAFVPLYRIFCNVMGIPLPAIAVGKAAEMKQSMVDPLTGAPLTSTRTVVVKFMANNSADMPVSLRPEIHKIRLQLGEYALTSYKANNPTAQSIAGVAVHTIIAEGGADVPDMKKFIDLQQCFCFEEQTYPARKQVNLPLSFAITPDLPADIHTITFAYTLFPAEE